MKELQRMLNLKNPPGGNKMSNERKVSNKECAIRLILKALAGFDDEGATKEEIEEVLGARTTSSRIDKINGEVAKQRARVEKLFAKYLEGLG